MGKFPSTKKLKMLMTFTPTMKRNNIGNIGHPALLNNIGVIRLKVKKNKKDK